MILAKMFEAEKYLLPGLRLEMAEVMIGFLLILAGAYLITRAFRSSAE